MTQGAHCYVWVRKEAAGRDAPRRGVCYLAGDRHNFKHGAPGGVRRLSGRCRADRTGHYLDAKTVRRVCCEDRRLEVAEDAGRSAALSVPDPLTYPRQLGHIFP